MDRALKFPGNAKHQSTKKINIIGKNNYFYIKHDFPLS